MPFNFQTSLEIVVSQNEWKKNNLLINGKTD